MRQKTLIVEDLDELKKQIPQIAREYDESTYESGFINISYCNTNKSDVKDALLLLKKTFPKLVISGMSEGPAAFYYHMDHILMLNFNFFDESKAEVMYKIISQDDDPEIAARAFVKEVREKIESIENVKSIHLFLSKIGSAAQEFIEELSDGYEEIPIFGVVASAGSLLDNEGVPTLDRDGAVIIGNTSIGPGMSICLCYGESLFTYVDYLFGWEPIGRYLDVEIDEKENERGIKVNKIDGVKASEIFKKYLGVTAGPHFVNNVGEFPIVVERNGMYMGRTPTAIGEDGEVYFVADIKQGEKIRFSYAERRDILRKTRDAVAKMESFAAESLWLIICGNRFSFLQEEYQREVKYFSESRDMPPGMSLGLGEVYRLRGKGGILNSALVAVGMREGLDGWSFSVLKPAKVEAEQEGIIPLHERLAHFLSAMTGELIEMAKEADAANEAKSRFLSNMSHEIRTPINAILGMDEVILRETEDPQIIEYAQNIRVAGNTLLSLVNDILDFSKIEAGKMDIIPVDYDPSSIINDLIQMIAPRAKAKGIDLKIELDSSIPCILNGDEIRIKQVVTNILTNAIKYTERGSITLNGSHEFVSDDEIDITISVKDTGIGIREEDLKKLYVAFQRVDEKRNRTIEGTGLGLNITQRLLKLMGSELKVKSTYGEGSEFSFTVRQKIVNKTPMADYIKAYNRADFEKQIYHEKFTAPDAEVLVVDDTPTNLTVFEGLLKRTKVKISKADSGAKCLEMTKIKKYDIIFLDHRMPVMDGIETLKRLKSDPENKNLNTTIISLTANAVSGAREQYMEAGFDDYLTKPIISEKLESMMLEYLPKDKVTLHGEGDAGAEEDVEAEPVEIPDWLKDYPAISVSDGVRNCGSIAAFMDTIRTFTDTLPDSFSDIKLYFENEDLDNYSIKVHALKSSARIIGLNEISALAASLEAAGDAGDLDTIKRDTPHLLDMYRKILEDFSQKGDNGDAEDESLPVMDEEKFKEAVDALKEVAATFDFDSVSYIMETINGFRVPTEHKEFIANLKKAVSAANWDEINRLLEAGGK